MVGLIFPKMFSGYTSESRHELEVRMACQDRVVVTDLYTTATLKKLTSQPTLSRSLHGSGARLSVDPIMRDV